MPFRCMPTRGKDALILSVSLGLFNSDALEVSGTSLFVMLVPVACPDSSPVHEAAMTYRPTY